MHHSAYEGDYRSDASGDMQGRVDVYRAWRAYKPAPGVELKSPEKLMLLGLDLFMGPNIEQRVGRLQPDVEYLANWTELHPVEAVDLESELIEAEFQIYHLERVLRESAFARARLRELIESWEIASDP